MRVDQKVVMVERDVPEVPGEISGLIGMFQFENKAFRDNPEVAVKIVEEDFPDSNDDAGIGSGTVSIEEMVTDIGAAIPLRPSDGGSFKNVAYLKIVDPPKKPELPEAPLPKW